MSHITLERALVLLAQQLGSNPGHLVNGYYEFSMPYPPSGLDPYGFSIKRKYVEDTVQRVNDIPGLDLPKELAGLTDEAESDFKMLTTLITARLQGNN